MAVAASRTAPSAIRCSGRLRFRGRAGFRLAELFARQRPVVVQPANLFSQRATEARVVESRRARARRPTLSPRNLKTSSDKSPTTPEVLVAFPPKRDSGKIPMTISRAVVQPMSRRFRGRRGRPGILSTAGIERRFDV